MCLFEAAHLSINFLKIVHKLSSSQRPVKECSTDKKNIEMKEEERKSPAPLGVSDLDLFTSLQKFNVPISHIIGS